MSVSVDVLAESLEADGPRTAGSGNEVTKGRGLENGTNPYIINQVSPATYKLVNLLPVVLRPCPSVCRA